jgi:hypothetical protein
VAGVQIVIPEYGNDRHREAARRIGQNLGLLRLAMRRQIACQQDDVRLTLDGHERLHDPRAGRLRCVDVPGGGNLDHA